MVRTPSYDKFGLKKGTWTPEEDKKLVDYITKYGHWNWRQLPKHAGLARCGKSCRLRWVNYLRPNVRRGNYTKEEEETIMRLHQKLGNRWSAIAAQLPGRTDNEIKNHWHTYLKKQVPQNTTSSTISYPNDDFSQHTESSCSQESEAEAEAEANNMHIQDQVTQKINEISCFSTTTTTAYNYSPQLPQGDYDYALMVEDLSEKMGDFWSEPFFPESSILMPNEDFAATAAAAEDMMFPDGLLSPPHDFFDGEQSYEYDNLFSSF